MNDRFENIESELKGYRFDARKQLISQTLGVARYQADKIEDELWDKLVVAAWVDIFLRLKEEIRQLQEASHKKGETNGTVKSNSHL